jgi:sugar phosphate isomerase/epimerase
MSTPKPISIQLYTVRDLMAKEGISVIQTIADIGYAGIEIGGSYYGKTAREFRKFADDVGVKISGAHVALFDSAQRGKIVEEAGALGYKHVIGGFGPKEFESESTVKAAAEKLELTAAWFASQGLEVSYHNHDWEFRNAKLGALFYESAPHANLQIDIYWVAVGGQDPAEAIRRYARRVKLLHIKDGPADPNKRELPMTAAGQGKIDIPNAIRAGEYGDVEWNIVELDHCATDMMQAVRDSYDYLTRRGLASGKR